MPYDVCFEQLGARVQACLAAAVQSSVGVMQYVCNMSDGTSRALVHQAPYSIASDTAQLPSVLFL